ncbi:MAG: TM1802 family CRISPR-associated protein [Balneolaceae bacterium]
MLDTLKKIGDQLLEGQGVWASLITDPKFNPDKNNWVCPILFDCINREIRFLNDEMKLFKEESTAVKFRYISPRIWGPRGKKCALTVEQKNFQMLEETLFGKHEGDDGSMMDSMTDFNSEFKNSLIYAALKEINETLAIQRSTLDLGGFKDNLGFGNSEEVVLFYSLIRSEHIQDGDPIQLTKLDEYEDFIIGKFRPSENVKKGIDYVGGNISDKTVVADFSGRYNIHKIFQKTAANYASGFSFDFRKNFQADPETLSSLDRASDYVLKRLKTNIAGISHIVVPSLLHKDLNEEFDIHTIEIFIDTSSDLLFRYQSLDTEIEKSFPQIDLFWINYIAFESDGNSFKVINHINDVNSAYLKKLIELFGKTSLQFRDYIGDRYGFNLQLIYRMIPVRDGQKSKLNPVLNLFKDILEQRPIKTDVLFDHFITLALCHWYGRYRAFPNIFDKFESFDFAIKDAVFKYSALIYALKQLNLIDMEREITQEENNKITNSEFQQRINRFFEKMDYGNDEKAIFYLGRVLSSIAYAQYKKGHKSKPVLNKVNFNGMDVQAIVRLSLDMAEKARQYNIHRETDWDFARFRERFNEKNWSLPKEQNVFYLMAGYSFGLTKSDNQSKEQ